MEVKAGYKKTDVGVIPANWDVKALGELAKLYQPQTISAKKFTETGFPVYGANGIVGYYHSANHRTWQVTVTCRGSTCGTVNRTVDECWITGNSMVLNCDSNSTVNKTFLYQLLKGQDLSVCITGTGQPQIVRSPLASFRVPFPPAPEQQAIAKALSDVDQLMASLDALIAKKHHLKQAAMQQLLTGKTRLQGFSGDWETKRLGEIGTISGAGVDKKLKEGEDFVRLLNYMDVYRNAFIQPTLISHVTTAPADKIKRCSIQGGDVFFTPTSETRDDIGKSAVALSEADDVVYSYHLVRLRLHEKWDKYFCAYVFQTREFLDQASMLCEGSGTRYVITLPKFRSIKITAPVDHAEQAAIGKMLFDIDQEIESLSQRRDKITALKQGMMQELLTGRTRLV